MIQIKIELSPLPESIPDLEAEDIAIERERPRHIKNLDQGRKMFDLYRHLEAIIYRTERLHAPLLFLPRLHGLDVERE